ncbi:MAG: hypothetical protein IPK04_06140 [Bdellovibrionales bacterium]|nr:hypothetical protein [Bdellovibrionales bacterium]
MCLSHVQIEAAFGQLGSDRISPLFAENEIIDITLKSDFPFGSYHKKSKPESFSKFRASLIYDWNGQKVERSVKVQARGSGRLQQCEFAPIKIHFKETIREDLFSFIDSDVKVVTHCQENKVVSRQRVDGFLLKEYLLYKILKAASVSVFDVRLVRIRYVTMGNLEVANRYAFFIEPIEHFISRNKNVVKVIRDEYFEDAISDFQMDTEKILNFYAQFDSQVDDSNYVANNLGQLLILNDDWVGSTRSPNTKSFLTTENQIISVHYDFDLSSLIQKFGPRKSKQGHTYPATVESDMKWILGFCSTERSGEISVERKSRLCPSVVNKILPTKDEVEKVIMQFSALATEDLQEIIERTKVFYQALKRVVQALEEQKKTGAKH